MLDCLLILHDFLEDARETENLKAINLISPVCQKHEALYTNRNTETNFTQLFYIIIKTDYTTGQNQNLQFPRLSFILNSKTLESLNQIGHTFTVKAEVDEEWIKEEDGGTQCLCLLLLPADPPLEGCKEEGRGFEDAQLVERLLNFFLSPL